MCVSRKKIVFPRNTIITQRKAKKAALDFKKAKRESENKNINYINRKLWIEPTIDDLYTFKDKYIDTCDGLNPLSFDIETAEGQTRCIGFAPSLKHAIVVPFWMPDPHFKSYWSSTEEENKAWTWVKEILEDEPSKACEKLEKIKDGVKEHYKLKERHAALSEKCNS